MVLLSAIFAHFDPLFLLIFSHSRNICNFKFMAISHICLNFFPLILIAIHAILYVCTKENFHFIIITVLYRILLSPHHHQNQHAKMCVYVSFRLNYWPSTKWVKILDVNWPFWDWAKGRNWIGGIQFLYKGIWIWSGWAQKAWYGLLKHLKMEN